MVDLLQTGNCTVFVHYSPDTLDAVVKDVLSSVTSFPFAFP